MHDSSSMTIHKIIIESHPSYARNFKDASTRARLFLSFNCLRTPSGKNMLYGRVGNFDTVFFYQQIPNFTNCKVSVVFKNCEHRMTHFISHAQSTSSFIIVNVFPFLFVESVYPRTYGAFRNYIYTVHIL